MMGGDCSASWGLLAVGRHRSREGCRGLARWIHSHTRRPSETGSPSARQSNPSGVRGVSRTGGVFLPVSR